MHVKDVFENALNFVRVEIIDSDVEKQRNDGCLVFDKQRFGLLEQFCALQQIGFVIGGFDERIVIRIFPAGAVVAVVAGEHSEKRLRIVVVANPTGAREFEIKVRLRAQIHLPLKLAQIHLDAQFVAPHLL